MTDLLPMQLPLKDLARPDSGHAHVWIMRLQNLPIMEAEVPPERKARLAQRRMGQKFMLRLLLGAYLGRPGREVRLQIGRFGKPQLPAELAESGLHFNLSHAGDWLAIALASDRTVGIDTEHVRRSLRWQKLARRYFSAAEADWLCAMDEPLGAHQFLKHWTAREALIKGAGRTIAGNISRVVLSTELQPGIISLPGDWLDPSDWQLMALDLQRDLVTHLASQKPLKSVRCFALDL